MKRERYRICGPDVQARIAARKAPAGTNKGVRTSVTRPQSQPCDGAPLGGYRVGCRPRPRELAEPELAKCPERFVVTYGEASSVDRDAGNRLRLEVMNEGGDGAEVFIAFGTCFKAHICREL